MYAVEDFLASSIKQAHLKIRSNQTPKIRRNAELSERSDSFERQRGGNGRI